VNACLPEQYVRLSHTYFWIHIVNDAFRSVVDAVEQSGVVGIDTVLVDSLLFATRCILSPTVQVSLHHVQASGVQY
jgi:hypothetical protein